MRVALFIAIAIALGACIAEVPATTATGEPSASSTAPRYQGALETGDIRGFSTDLITIDGEEYPVAVADNSGRRNRGLRGVRDFGDLVGMLFVFDEPVNVAFTMNDTVTPLTLNLLDAEGVVLEIITMDLCDGQPCRFQPTVTYIYALELPQDGLSLEVGDTVGLAAE